MGKSKSTKTDMKKTPLPIHILWMIEIGKMLSPHKKQTGEPRIGHPIGCPGCKK